MAFSVHNVSKAFGNLDVLHDVSLSVGSGEIASIVGPSGSGKTTLLKIIADVESPDTGNVSFDLKPSKEHPVLLVFQDYVLFPHMSVFENVAFGLRSRKTYTKGEIRKKVWDMLSYFGIEEKAEQYPSRLSGGQKQRVAIARAMIVNPYVLLLDEPFANLDKNLKLDTAEFIRNTQKHFGITTVSVTHDLEEAFIMSDKIGILLDGKLEQFDSVENVYLKPSSYNAARFLGPVNIIPTEILPDMGVTSPPSGGLTQVYARAEGLEIRKNPGGNGVITRVCFIGSLILYFVDFGKTDLKVYSLSSGLQTGDRVDVRLHNFFTQAEEHT